MLPEGSRHFKRGWVVRAHFPETKDTVDTPHPSYIMKGEHFAVLLHDHDSKEIDPRTALVMPITSAIAESKKALKEKREMLASYVPIEQADHPFLDHDSYVNIGQIVPLSREWLTSYRGEIDPDLMLFIDVQIVKTFNLQGALDVLVAQALRNITKDTEQSSGDQ